MYCISPLNMFMWTKYVKINIFMKILVAQNSLYFYGSRQQYENALKSDISTSRGPIFTFFSKILIYKLQGVQWRWFQVNRTQTDGVMFLFRQNADLY